MCKLGEVGYVYVALRFVLILAELENLEKPYIYMNKILVAVHKLLC